MKQRAIKTNVPLRRRCTRMISLKNKAFFKELMSRFSGEVHA
jgi:hypothetical protein